MTLKYVDLQELYASRSPLSEYNNMGSGYFTFCKISNENSHYFFLKKILFLQLNLSHAYHHY